MLELEAFVPAPDAITKSRDPVNVDIQMRPVGTDNTLHLAFDLFSTEPETAQAKWTTEGRPWQTRNKYELWVIALVEALRTSSVACTDVSPGDLAWAERAVREGRLEWMSRGQTICLPGIANPMRGA